MDKETELYYEELMDTFSTPGWKHIMEKVESIKDSLNDLATTVSTEDFWLKKGRVAELNYWLQFEKVHRQFYQELLDGKEDI